MPMTLRRRPPSDQRRSPRRLAVGGALAALLVAATFYDGSSGGFTRLVPAPVVGVEAQGAAFSINNISSAEGNAGRKTFTFTVSLTGANPALEHRVTYRTADGSATGPTTTRSSSTPISIPIIGTATPYPLAIDVGGLAGTIDDVAVRFENLTHTYPEDLDVLLVGPGGQNSMFMSDVGGWNDVSNINLTFRDGAPPPSATQLTSGTYSPSNIATIESLPAPAPAGPYPIPLSVFNGTSPNGQWRLFIEDDFTTDVGTLAGVSLIFSLSGTGDFIPSEGELVFPPGVTSMPVTVTVKADEVVEATENFFVNLSAPVNAVIADAQGVGTIFNDDGAGVPIAENDSYVVPLNTTLTVNAPGILANDDSNEGGAMTALLVSNVAHGTLFLYPNGSFSYTADPGYAGADSFVYRAVTSNGGSNDAVVSLSVAVPSSADDAATTPANRPLNAPAPGVLANDNSNGGGGMAAALVGNPTYGSVTLNPDGSFVYVPALNFLGVDTFTYRAITARGPGNVATVSITVTPPTTAQSPTALVVDSVRGNQVTVRFAAPLLGPAPTGYILKGGVSPGEVLAAFPTGTTAPIFTFNAPTGSFFIRVHTLVGGAESPASNEVPLHVNVPVTPSAPATLLGLVNGSDVTLAWKNTYGGGPPSNVILSVRGDMDLEVPLGLRDSISFAGVPPGTYTVRVRGAVRGSWGASSNPVTLTFPRACTGAPLPPTNFLAYRVGNVVYAIWDPPAGGPAPSAYRLNVSGSYVGSFTTAGRALSGTVGRGDYKIEVVSLTPCGTSPSTPPQTVQVP